MVAVVGRVSVPELVTVALPENVSEELVLGTAIVPVFKRVVIFEMDEVFGSVIVAPVLLVSVVGIIVRFAPETNARVPEFVIVPPIDMLDAALKFVVQLALFTNPVPVIDVRAGSVSVVALFVKVVMLEIVVKAGTVRVAPLLFVNAVIVESVVRLFAVMVPEFVMVAILEIVVPP
jgi:hypothetical protein